MFIVLRTLFLSLFLAVIFTPLARLLALKIGFVDIPNERKIHNFPMALMGGWAIYLSLIITLGFNKLLLDGSIPYLLISGLILLLIGTLDERGFLHPQIKLMAVMPVVGLIMVISGVKFNIFYSLFNNSILDILLTIFWFTGFIASFEIIDHMDGLNSGLTFIAALFFSVFFLNSRNYFLGCLSLIYAGSVLGFLLFNFYPAKLFLGDGGAMLNGFIMSFLGVSLSSKISNPLIKIILPLFILIVPFLDTSLCVFSRLKRGLIPFAFPGKDHVAHRLMNLGFSQRAVALMLYSVAGLGGSIALFMSAFTKGFLYIILSIFLVLYFIFIFWMESLPYTRQTKSEFSGRI